MKINEIVINNFRSINLEVFSPKERLNYFIGLTGSGKSNLLRAIEFLANSENNFKNDANNQNKNIKISLDLNLNENEAKILYIDILKTWILELSNQLRKLIRKLELTPSEINFVIIDDLYKGLLLKCYDEKYISKNYQKIWSDKKVLNERQRIIDLISDDLETLNYYCLEKINLNYNFVQKFEIDTLNFLTNFAINFSKIVSKNNKSLNFISNRNNINGIISGLISNFTEFFNFKQLGSLKEIDTWEYENKKIFDWFEIAYSDFISNNFYNHEGVNNQNFRMVETAFIFDLSKLISIFSWNRNLIDLNSDSISFEENKDNVILKKLLSLINLDINKMSLYQDDSIFAEKSILLDKHINNRIEEYWQNFVMEGLQIKTIITNKFLKFTVRHLDNKIIDISNESEGLKQFLSIVLSIDYSLNSYKTILLIDEPESHLHLEGVIALRKLLNNASKNYLNIFITTNSVQMVDPDKLELFHLIEKINMSSQIINIVETNKKNQIPDLIKQSFGTGVFSKFLSEKYSFFVKDIIDKNYLNKFIKHYGISANVFVYYESKAIEFIEGIKLNFYEDYFNDNCFFIFDGTNEAHKTKQIIEKEFQNMNWFTLSQIFPGAKQTDLTIEYLYSPSMLKEYKSQKKLLEDNWKNTSQELNNKINTENLDLNKSFENEYIKPLKKLKMELSNSIKNNKSFIDVSDEEKIKILIVFLEERGVTITSY